MSNKLLEQIKADRDTGTPGPWSAFNMTHEDRGDQMTPDEVGEYVANSVRMGCWPHFLFVGGKHSDGGDCDVCHVGNGPLGPYNARRIARVPEMEDRILADADEITRLRAELAAANAGEEKLRDDIAALKDHSLDAIMEVIGAPKEYNSGKSAMRDWFVKRIDRILSKKGGDI